MKDVIFSGKPDLYRRSGTSFEDLSVLMAVMGINNLSGINVPEQEFILRTLKKHEPEGLFTRELADQCEMSIYKVRHLLLPLEKHGQVLRVKIQKHHKWCLATELADPHVNNSEGDLQQR